VAAYFSAETIVFRPKPFYPCPEPISGSAEPISGRPEAISGRPEGVSCGKRGKIDELVGF